MRLSVRIASLEPSKTLEITERAARLRDQGRDVISLSAGEPDFDTPQHIKDAAVRAIAEGRTKYTPAAGLPALRQAIADKLKRENGFPVPASQVMVTAGAKQAIYNVMMAALNDGDEVLIPSPFWVSYPDMAKAAGAVPVPVPGDPKRDYKVNADALAVRITPRTRMLIMNSPGNPTGSVYDEGEWRAIADLVVRRDLLLLSDEIYEKLIYEGSHVCPASFGDDVRARTVVVNGVSKSYAMTGWRIGYAAGPAEVVRAAINLQSQSTSNPASISQYAALAGLTGDTSFIEGMAAEFRRRRDRFCARLAQAPRLGVPRPPGAFYVFVDVSKTGLNSTEFCGRLLDEEGVAGVPGAAFGSDRHVRFSFATGIETLDRAAERILKFERRL